MRSGSPGAAPALRTPTIRALRSYSIGHVLPAFHDPFAGGGSLPLEAQRLGLEAHASDLNPVAVLINKAMIEIPPRFAGRPPVNPEARSDRRLMHRTWRDARGLADDVRYYGRWMRDEAEKRIGHLYPKVRVTAEMALDRPDLEPYVCRDLTVIAWLWARTVKSPNPAFADVDVPLASTFVLSNKKGKEAYVEPVIEGSEYRFKVKAGVPPEESKRGTKLSRGANFRCIMSRTPIAGDYIKAEGKAGRMGARLMAIVAEGDRGRVYLSPTSKHELIFHSTEPTWMPDAPIGPDRRSMFTPLYGLTHFKDLFTNRQLVALTTFSDLVAETRGTCQAARCGPLVWRTTVYPLGTVGQVRRHTRKQSGCIWPSWLISYRIISQRSVAGTSTIHSCETPLLGKRSL